MLEQVRASERRAGNSSMGAPRGRTHTPVLPSCPPGCRRRHRQAGSGSSGLPRGLHTHDSAAIMSTPPMMLEETPTSRQ
jgi:hypothetical protein